MKLVALLVLSLLPLLHAAGRSSLVGDGVLDALPLLPPLLLLLLKYWHCCCLCLQLVNLAKLEVVSLMRYRRVFQLGEVGPAASRDELMGAVRRHFATQVGVMV